MDKIYSRAKFKIPRPKIKSNGIKKSIKINKILLIIIIASCTIYMSIKSLNPIFEDLCMQKLDVIATDIMNEEAGNVVKDYNYKDIISIAKNGEINVLKTDVAAINELSTKITSNIVKRLRKLEKGNINIPAGALLGSKLLSAAGPNIKIKISPIGSVNTEIKTEFLTQGINQTIYRVYLNITSNMKVVMPYKSTKTAIKSQVLLVETAIVGDVPTTYYNLEGITEGDTLNLLE